MDDPRGKTRKEGKKKVYGATKLLAVIAMFQPGSRACSFTARLPGALAEKAKGTSAGGSGALLSLGAVCQLIRPGT